MREGRDEARRQIQRCDGWDGRKRTVWFGKRQRSQHATKLNREEQQRANEIGVFFEPPSLALPCIRSEVGKGDAQRDGDARLSDMGLDGIDTGQDECACPLKRILLLFALAQCALTLVV